MIKKVNYLHYGNGLNELTKQINSLESFVSKKEAIAYLNKYNLTSKYAVDIIRGYHGEYIDEFNFKTFSNDLKLSIDFRSFFNDLNCRGFSYTVVENFDFSYKLKKCIDFRFALVTDKNLYFPPRLRRYLPRPHKNHIRINKYPSIAFALGQIVGKNLYVNVIQSDLFFNGPAVIREYIKGWRKVLFAELIEFMQGKVKAIYLTTADEIFQTCHPDYKKPVVTPKIWYQIYDETAIYFKMKKRVLTNPVNIQTLNDLPTRNSFSMFYLKL